MADRVAVVTGAGRGVGAAIARRLSSEDWAVVVVDSGVEPDGSGYDPDPAEQVSGQIWEAGGSARPVCADVTTRAGLEFAMETATRLGSPTALVHAAGIVAEQAVATTTDESWRSVLAVHLDAAFAASRAFWPLFQSAGGGRIVLVGGADGLLGEPGRAGYAAAKSGLIGLMRVLAAEGAASGISANLVLPFAETRLSASRSPGVSSYPNGASGARAEDVAPLVAWLCSGQGAAITGQVLGVRGAELTVWSQPRPVARIVATEGWTPQAFQPLTHPAMVPLLSPLGPEEGLLGGDPIPVRTEVPITGRVLDVTERRAADLFPEVPDPAEGSPRAAEAGGDGAGGVIYLDDDARPDGVGADDGDEGDGDLPDGYVMTDVLDRPGDPSGSAAGFADAGPGAYLAYPEDHGDVIDVTDPEYGGSGVAGGHADQVDRDGGDFGGARPAAGATDPATHGWPLAHGWSGVEAWPEAPVHRHEEPAADTVAPAGGDAGAHPSMPRPEDVDPGAPSAAAADPPPAERREPDPYAAERAAPDPYQAKPPAGWPYPAETYAHQPYPPAPAPQPHGRHAQGPAAAGPRPASPPAATPPAATPPGASARGQSPPGDIPPWMRQRPAERPAPAPGRGPEPERAGVSGAGQGTVTWQVPTGWQAPAGWTPPAGWAPVSGWAPQPPEAGVGPEPGGTIDLTPPERQAGMPAHGARAGGRGAVSMPPPPEGTRSGPDHTGTRAGSSLSAIPGADAGPSRRRGAWRGWRRR